MTKARLVRAAALLATLAAFAPQAYGQQLWKPPTDIYALPISSRAKPSVKTELMKELRIGDVVVTLGDTPMKDAETKLGATQGESGDASDYLAWVCVQGADSAGRWIMWLRHGEMGDEVEDMQWRRLSAQQTVDPRCRVVAGEVRPSLPVRLGMPRDEIVALLGKPTAQNKITVLYSHERPVPFEGTQWMLRNEFLALFRDGNAYAIAISRYRYPSDPAPEPTTEQKTTPEQKKKFDVDECTSISKSWPSGGNPSPGESVMFDNCMKARGY